MRCIQPSYFKNFSCDGEICGCRCCRDWRIVVDDDTYKNFETLAENEREEIFSKLEWVREENSGVEVMVLKLREDGRCSFLDDDSLCKLQKNHGENFLTAICQSFPRVTYKLDEENFFQAMTITCPLAANLILFPIEPITFEEVHEVSARAVISFKKKLARPAEEVFKIQMDAVKILQDRNFSINRRLKNLCKFFYGEDFPDADFNLERHAEVIVEIFSKTYGKILNEQQAAHLRNNYSNYREEILKQVHENFSHMFENYLVNEIFVRCYPFAFSDDEFHNCKIFVTAFKILEFSLVLTVVAKKRLNVGDVTTLIYSVNDMLDHSRGGMDEIIEFATNCDAKNFAACILED